jgi:C-terminal processing protease CtpA/Prc
MIPRKQLAQIAQIVQGIPVWGCLEGSPSEDAGVRYGDIVLGVNGMRTLNIEDYLAARKLRTDGVELRLLRGGNELTLRLEFRPANEANANEPEFGLDEDRIEFDEDQHEEPRLGESTASNAWKGVPN